MLQSGGLSDDHRPVGQPARLLITCRRLGSAPCQVRDAARRADLLRHQLIVPQSLEVDEPDAIPVVAE